MCIIGEERKASVCEFVYTCEKGMKEGRREGGKEGRQIDNGSKYYSGLAETFLHYFLCLKSCSPNKTVELLGSCTSPGE